MPSVPTLSWDEIYDTSSSGEVNPRLKRFFASFAERYESTDGLQIIRSPGRVNIIGEHLDYSNFPVFPMAVDRDLIMGFRKRASGSSSNTIRLANTDSVTFEPSTFELPATTEDTIKIDSSVSHWSNYFKCGLVVAQNYMMGKYDEELPEDQKSTNNAYFYSNGNALVKSLTSLDILVDGNVPTGSGLSSSAAFVVCATLASLMSNAVMTETASPFKFDKFLLVKLSIKCEQYVGVNSGGMDQAASICGILDHALLVNFYPTFSVDPKVFPTPPIEQESNDGSSAPTPKRIKLEDGAHDAGNRMCFVIAHTLVVSNKHETAPTNYNLRVVELSLASLILARKLGLDAKEKSLNQLKSAKGERSLLDLVLPPLGNLQSGTLRDVFELYAANLDETDLANASKDKMYGREIAVLQKLIIETEKHLRDDYTYEDLPALLCHSSVSNAIESPATPEDEATKSKVEKEIKNLFFTNYKVKFSILKLRQRALHVFSEAARVYEFIQTATDYNTNLGTSKPTLQNYFQTVQKLGQLMDKSQESMSKDFQCSCDEADKLCNIARKPTVTHIDESTLTGSEYLSYGSRTTGAGWGGATVHLTLEKNVSKLIQRLKDEYYKEQDPKMTSEQVDKEAIIISVPANGTAILKL